MMIKLNIRSFINAHNSIETENQNRTTDISNTGDIRWGDFQIAKIDIFTHNIGENTQNFNR